MDEKYSWIIKKQLRDAKNDSFYIVRGIFKFLLVLHGTKGLGRKVNTTRKNLNNQPDPLLYDLLCIGRNPQASGESSDD